ncbi:hypothetical protein CFC21_080443 [Triticum aestivum]|uniref:F-box domain-containing protein n=2 Tax=Triticum aestivum TaxID=4565 RepID=A0A3B6MZD9_WHEAT|nr:putative F-box protein At3g10240 [Triticum aestivum]KAF7075684.1 hypothetical protein CFC21_080443 [Triticum aestivum]
MLPPEEITLNDDVLTEILLRVPPKSILRARAVSKHWRHIATRPCFLTAYALRRQPEIVAFFRLDQGDEPADDKSSTNSKYNKIKKAVCAIPFDDDLEGRPLLYYDPTTMLFRGFCYGLLLFNRGCDSLLIWNPATRQVGPLPSPPMASSRASVQPFCFYYHRPSGRYRVLCHVDDIPADDTANYILSTGAAEPRRLGDTMPDGVLRESSAVTLHGSLHWLIHPAKSCNPDKMVAFDTVSEKFRTMAPPPVPAADSLIYKTPHLFEMNGALAVSAMRDAPHMEVWTLEDYNQERWAWRLRIGIPQYRICSPFTASAIGVLEVNMLVVQHDGRVMLHDMAGKRNHRTVKVGTTGDISTVWRHGIYMESLVPLTPSPS